jgi:hypothetical protein
MRSARMLAVGAPVFGFAIWVLLASGPAHVITVIAIAVLPFWILAIAIRARHRNGTWRFGGRDIHALAAVVAALIAIPAVWWFVDRSPSSTNCVLGCLVVLVPVSLPFILAFGLALAAESADENGSP